MPSKVVITPGTLSNHTLGLIVEKMGDEFLAGRLDYGEWIRLRNLMDDVVVMNLKAGKKNV